MFEDIDAFGRLMFFLRILMLALYLFITRLFLVFKYLKNNLNK
jgi:hypothetical protein